MSRKLSQRGKLHVGQPCYYCRRPMIANLPLLKEGDPPHDVELVGQTATMDHVHPRSKGGGNEVSNIVICCQRCNGLKGHMPYEIFVEFARVVIKQYPYEPQSVLKSALQQFLDSLAEIAIRNQREAKRALSLALLSMGGDVRPTLRGKGQRVNKGAK